jgi:hypothetical protein
MTRQDDFITGFRAADQLGQLALSFAHGNSHLTTPHNGEALFLDHLLVQNQTAMSHMRFRHVLSQ